ncbi:ABC tran domain containing protein, partial [Asbolus verrucosus]
MGVSYIGLILMQLAVFPGLASFLMKSFTEIDAQMASVERVVEYTQLIPENDDGSDLVPELWPVQTNIEFQSVSMRYSESDPYVLHRISFKVESGQKIGIVGRTGAGKSSLIVALFRLFPFEGNIVIDGVDTKTIPLNSLRSKISIIPQDPVLFPGTLRKNLDPFDEYADAEIWNALDEVKLKQTVSTLMSGLEHPVLEGGSNFSVGQKQLLCLVRTMLRKNKIIVLDEATANIDLTTDEIIQSTIKTKFKD